MKIAILGATSQVGRGFIKECTQHTNDVKLYLFARTHEKLNAWLPASYQARFLRALPLEAFGRHQYDAILNLIGSGDPRQTQAMGKSIVDVSDQYDIQVLTYLQKNPECRYIFLSSGSVHKGDFELAVCANSDLKSQTEAVSNQDWYVLSKLRAEARHRALAELSIVDIRLFSYFSADQNPLAGFLLSDIMRAIYFSEALVTSQIDVYRDYLGPDDMYALIWAALQAKRTNGGFDSYSLAPINKFEILDSFAHKFNLRVHLEAPSGTLAIQPVKTKYYSTNHAASALGFTPRNTSLKTLEAEMRRFVRYAESLKRQSNSTQNLSHWMPFSW